MSFCLWRNHARSRFDFADRRNGEEKRMRRFNRNRENVSGDLNKIQETRDENDRYCYKYDYYHTDYF